MPTYSFRDKETGEEFDVFMKISELDEYLEKNPNVEKLLSAPVFNGAQGVTLYQKFHDPKGRQNA
jgi:predicted nucleic acid-binding Zn ribbon protein